MINKSIQKSILKAFILSSIFLFFILILVGWSIYYFANKDEMQNFNFISKNIKDEISIIALTDNNRLLNNYLKMVKKVNESIKEINLLPINDKFKKGDYLKHSGLSNWLFISNVGDHQLKIIFESNVTKTMAPFLIVPIFFVLSFIFVHRKLNRTIRFKLINPIKEIEEIAKFYTNKSFEKNPKQIKLENQSTELTILFELLDNLYRHQLDKLNYSDKLKKDIEEATKAKTAFIASMVHDFKTPIISIRGIIEEAVELFSDDNIDSKTIQDFYQMLMLLKSLSLELEQTTVNLLDLSRLESTKMLDKTIERVNFKKMILDAISSFSVQARHNSNDIFYEINLKNDILIDKKKYLQVFNNILSNALKYNKNDEILISIYSNGSKIVTDITDHGKGIPKDLENTIFIPFKRSKNNLTEGTGIGLSFSKMLLSHIGGDISFKNNYPGVTFSFYFPFEQEIEGPVKSLDKKNKVFFFTSFFLKGQLIQDIIKYKMNATPIEITEKQKDIEGNVIFDGIVTEQGVINYKLLDNHPSLFETFKKCIKSKKCNVIILSKNEIDDSKLKAIGVDRVCHALDLATGSNNRLSPITPHPKISDSIKNLNLLVCDDNKTYQELLIKKLRKAGFKNIFTALEGGEAIKITEEHPLDVIFMDHMMPVMDGITAARIIKKKNPEVFILGFTAAKSEVSHFDIESMDMVFLKDLTKTNEIISLIEEHFSITSQLGYQKERRGECQ